MSYQDSPSRAFIDGLQLPMGVSPDASCAVLDMARQWDTTTADGRDYNMHEDEDLAYELGRLLRDHYNLTDDLIAELLVILPIEQVVGKGS